MNIFTEFKPNHQKLSQCSAAFLEHAEQNPAALEYDSYPLLTGYEEEMSVLQPWPTLVNQHTGRQIRDAAVDVVKLIKDIPKRLFDNDPEAVSRYFDIPVKHAAYYLLGVNDYYLENLIGRGDFIFSDSGLKCVEYNISTALGGTLLNVWHNLYLKSGIIAGFLERHHYKPRPNLNLLTEMIQHIISNGAEQLAGADGEVNTVFVGFQEPEAFEEPHKQVGYKIYKQVLAEKFENLEGEVMFCDYSHLQIADDKVYFRGKRIHCILTYDSSFLPVPVTMVFDKGNVLLYNGNIPGILLNKLTLALLSENRDSGYYNEVEQAKIDKHIPWTRKVGDWNTDFKGDPIHLPDFIRSNKDLLVLKDAWGGGGKKVLIGKSSTPEQWEEALNIALYKTPYIVQEYTPPVQFLYQNGKTGCAPYDSIWGLFVAGNRYLDGFLRILPAQGSNGVVNCAQGATVTKIIEVKE